MVGKRGGGGDVLTNLLFAAPEMEREKGCVED